MSKLSEYDLGSSTSAQIRRHAFSIPAGLSSVGSTDELVVLKNGEPSGVALETFAPTFQPQTQTVDQLGAAAALGNGDEFLIRQGGTTIVRATLSSLITYLAAQTPAPAAALTVSTPRSVISGNSVTVLGTYSNGTPSALDYSLNGGSTWTAASTPTIGSGVYSFSISGLALGDYTIRVRDHTTTSVAAVAPKTFSVVSGDRIVLDQPADIRETQALVATGSYVGTPTTIEYSLDNGTWTTLDPAPTGGFFNKTIAGVGSGSHVLKVRFSNATSTASPNSSFFQVTPLPTISVDTPSNVSTASPVTITGSYADDTPTALQYSTDGGITWNLAPSPTIGGGTFSFSLNGLADKYWDVYVRLKDYAGAVNHSGYFVVGKALLILPGATSFVGGSTVTMTGKLSVSGSVFQTWDGNTGDNAGVAFPGGTPPISFTTNAFQIPAKAGTYQALFFKNNNDAQCLVPITVTDPASIILWIAYNNGNTTYALTDPYGITGNYGGGTLTSIEYQWDGGSWLSDGTATIPGDGTYSLLVPSPASKGLSAGFHTIKVRAAGVTASASFGLGRNFA